MTLRAGEVLFVPRHWWHDVQTVSHTALSVNHWIALPTDRRERVKEALVALLATALLPSAQVIPPLHLVCRTKGGVRNSWPPCRLFLGPGFRLGARWNRLGEAVKTRKKREKTGGKWARYGLKGVNGRRIPPQELRYTSPS